MTVVLRDQVFPCSPCSTLYPSSLRKPNGILHEPHCSQCLCGSHRSPLIHPEPRLRNRPLDPPGRRVPGRPESRSFAAVPGPGTVRVEGPAFLEQRSSGRLHPGPPAPPSPVLHPHSAVLPGQGRGEGRNPVGLSFFPSDLVPWAQSGLAGSLGDRPTDNL